MWGQGTPTYSDLGEDGIIPTRVGTSFAEYKEWRKNKDHPHACGDKFFDSGQLRFVLGSSPRVWGQELNECRKQCLYRIIPTRVGTRDGMCRYSTIF